MIDESVLKTFNETAWANWISRLSGGIETGDMFLILDAVDFIFFSSLTGPIPSLHKKELRDVVHKCKYSS